MNSESIKEVPFVEYIGHVISAYMKDDLDIMRHKARRFHMCSDNVKGCCESNYLTLLLFVFVHFETVLEIQG